MEATGRTNSSEGSMQIDLAAHLTGASPRAGVGPGESVSISPGVDGQTERRQGRALTTLLKPRLQSVHRQGYRARTRDVCTSRNPASRRGAH